MGEYLNSYFFTIAVMEKIWYNNIESYPQGYYELKYIFNKERIFL